MASIFHCARRSVSGVVQVIAGQCDDGVVLQLEPRTRLRVRADGEVEVAVGVELQGTVVQRSDDAVAVVAVVGSAVDGDRQVDRIAPVAGHPVGAGGGVDRRQLIERVRVVAAPTADRADHVDEPRIVLVAPDIGVDGDAQQAEREPIPVEDVGFRQWWVAGQELAFDPAEFVEQLVESGRQFIVCHVHSFFSRVWAPCMTREQRVSTRCRCRRARRRGRRRTWCRRAR